MGPRNYAGSQASAAELAAQAEKLEQEAALAEMQLLNAQAAQLERTAKLADEAAQRKKMEALAAAAKLNSRVSMLEQIAGKAAAAHVAKVDEDRLNMLLLGIGEEDVELSQPQPDASKDDIRNQVNDAFRAALRATGGVASFPKPVAKSVTRPWEAQLTQGQWNARTASSSSSAKLMAPGGFQTPGSYSKPAFGTSVWETGPGWTGQPAGLPGMHNINSLREIASKNWGSEESNPLAMLQQQRTEQSQMQGLFVGQEEDSRANRAYLYQDMPGDLPAQETLQRRAELEVVVDGSAAHPIDSFMEAVGIPDYALRAILNMGIGTPLPIQAQALPIALAGRDLVGIARTGSGKTLAFLLPCIVHLEAQGVLLRQLEPIVTPTALVLAPTRELAIQIADASKALCQGSAAGRGMGLQTVVVYGGGRKDEQVNEMKYGCHILVATPGRLTDLLASNMVTLDRVTYFVLDEADRMMDQGFAAEVKEYSRRIRPDRQMLFFSATWPPLVQELARSLCHEGQTPVQLMVGQKMDGTVATRADIMQEVIVFEQATWEERDLAKQLVLYEHLRQVLQYGEAKVLVFVSRKVLADEMKYRLGSEGFCTEAMHGGRPQQERLNVLERFRNGEVKLLVATDVMGRGLDIPSVTHVVIYDMTEMEDYVHRIGRTCRGPDGQAGHALTFFEYDKRWPKLAGQLIKVLQESGQGIPEDLLAVANEVDQGLREKTWAGAKRKAPASWAAGPFAGGSTGNLLGAQLGTPRSGPGSGVCKYFGSARGCVDGAACQFSHSDPESVRPCEWFTSLEGCQYGDKCMFRHEGAIAMPAADGEPTLEATLEQAAMDFFRQQLLRRRTEP